jgi:hypothetical protein
MIQNISSSQLRRAAAIKEKIESLQKELASVLGNSAAEPTSAPSAQPSGNKTRKKRQLSPEGRARIIEAQKRRWAAKKKGK